VRDFLSEAFGLIGLDYAKHVDIDPRYLRPTEVDHLLSDPSKARATLGWSAKVDFQRLVRMMVEADIEREKTIMAGKKPTVYSLAEERRKWTGTRAQ
jgi:GDPmannose 4,6-dehydratase